VIWFYLLADGQDTNGNGKVEDGTFFSNVRRRHIHRDFLTRKFEVIVFESGLDALLTFPYGIIGQTDEVKIDADDQIDFNCDGGGMDSEDGTGIGFD
jgi:hypothetical protein